MGKRTYYGKTERVEKIGREEKLSFFFDLINAFSIVKNPIDTSLFLQDLLTAKEIDNLAKRLRIAKLILSNRKQEEIVEELHTSFGTIAKVKYWIDSGGKGFNKVISKLPVKYNIPNNLPRGPIEFHLPDLIGYLTQYAISSKQRKLLTKFDQNIKTKKKLDKSFREEAKEYYSEKQKITRKGQFIKSLYKK